MKEIRFTLVTEGPTDVVLMPVLKWVLQEAGVTIPVTSSFSKVPDRLTVKGLIGKIDYALKQYPCELLFVHRDADNDLPSKRRGEIEEAVRSLKDKASVRVPHHVSVVPVTMTEAWLLFDESAIRQAASNAFGRVPLKLPKIAEIERLSNPKVILNNLLLEAGEVMGRKRRKFERSNGSRLVANFLDDFSPLRSLKAFRALEADVGKIVEEQGWNRLR